MAQFGAFIRRWCWGGLIVLAVLRSGARLVTADLAAPAPATSRSDLLLGLGILAAIAAVALWRRELKHYLWSV